MIATICWPSMTGISASRCSRKRIRSHRLRVFDSESDLATQMLALVERYNLTATPFQWTYTGKVLVA